MDATHVKAFPQLQITRRCLSQRKFAKAWNDKLWLGLVVIQLAFSASEAFSVEVTEPKYSGKTFGEWLVQLGSRPTNEEVEAAEKADPSNPDTAFEKKRKRDEEAIRRIGTNALPLLLEVLGANQKNFRGVVSKLGDKGLLEASHREDFDIEDLR